MLRWSREQFQNEARRLVSALKNFPEPVEKVVTVGDHNDDDDDGDDDAVSPFVRFLKDWTLEEEDDANHGSGSYKSYYLSHPAIQREVQMGVVSDDDEVYGTITTSRRQEDTEYSMAFANSSEGEDEEDSRCFCDESVLLDDPTVVFTPDTKHRESNTATQTTTATTTTTTTTTIWYFTIVYSETWKAPILYFTVDYGGDETNKRGSPCSRSDVIKLLMQYSHYNRVEDAWEFLSQEEHPISRIPSFFLHPCRTMERLETLLLSQFATTTTSSSQGTSTSSISSHHDGAGAGVEDESAKGGGNITTTARTTTHRLEHNFLLLSWMSLILPSVGYAIPSKIHRILHQTLIRDNPHNIHNRKESEEEK